MAIAKIQMTEKDFQVITDAIISPMILSTLQYDIKIMPDIGLKLPIIYAAQARKIQKYIELDTPRLKTEMFKLGIRILGYEKTADGRTYKYRCRGYEQTFSLMTDLIRTKIITKVSEILDLDITEYGEKR